MTTIVWTLNVTIHKSFKEIKLLTHGAFTFDVKSVLNENLGGTLGDYVKYVIA
jgi:hypothetical protein